MIVSRLFFLAIIVVLVAACASAATPTPVPTTAPPTATRLPATNTPAPPTPTSTPTAVPPTAVPATPIPPTATATVRPVALKFAQHPTLGRILVDGDGRTLYLLTADKQGPSVCIDDCVKSWPPFLSPTKASALEGINAALIGTSQRKDAAIQATYNGWPLYYRVTDVKPGDATGQGLDGVWFVVTSTGDPLKPAGPEPTEAPGYHP